MIEKILLENYCKYPLMRIQDFFKLLYQGEFGCAHACGASQKDIADGILKEMNSLPRERIEHPLSEIISSSQLRVNLPEFARENLKPKTLAEMFSISARNACGDAEKFKNKIGVFEALVKRKEIGLPYLSTRSAIIKYLSCVKPVSHSATYKLNYKPHYRVVMRDYFDLFPAIEKINAIKEKDIILVAIDGNAGSGKTYYAEVLKNYFAPDCSVFHADDFFLPPSMRTPERLAEVGGNIHYERLKRLLTDLKARKNVVYQKYDCKSDLYAEISAPVCKINIIEGVYSARENLIDKYDIVIKLNIGRGAQQKRLLKRGADICKKFNSVWLPLENAYFKRALFPDAVNIQTDGFDLYSRED